jgi:hypothetical protein
MMASRIAAEEREAELYAEAIRVRFHTTDWARWNREIIARWSKTALLRIKTRGWVLAEAVDGVQWNAR